MGRYPKPEKLYERIYGIEYQFPEEQRLARRFTLMVEPPKAGTWKAQETEYRYHFFGGATPTKREKAIHDPVISVIAKWLQEINRDNIGMANATIYIVPTTTAPLIWPPNECHSDHQIKFYTFRINNEEFPPTVLITIIPRIEPLTIDKIHVRVQGEWRSISQWLLTFESSRHREYGVPAIHAQQKWWRRNGRVSKLMELPAEIRLHIFEHVLGPKIYPIVTDFKVPVDWSVNPPINQRDQRLVLGNGYSRPLLTTPHYVRITSVDNIEELGERVPAPNLSILAISKQVRSEALQAGWEGTRKYFFDTMIFQSVVQAQGGPRANYNCLAKIQLNFTHKAYFKFFGVEAERTIRHSPLTAMGSYLQNLPKPTDLQMRFRSPEDGWDGMPWGDLYGITEDRRPVECCQRTMVDWIMTFAFPYVKAIPKVTLEGYVKKDSKKKWEEILSMERAGQPHGFDQAEEMRAILEATSV
jgi:hypothetical protein